MIASVGLKPPFPQTMVMPKVLYGVSPIGLGHASRAVAIGQQLVGRGVNVRFVTGGAASSFLRSYGLDVHNLISYPTPAEFRGRVVLSSLWYLRFWWGYKGSKGRVEKLIQSVQPDLVVGDEEFTVLSLAVERGIKSVMVSDELELAFARNRLTRAIERRVYKWYKELQRKVDMLIVPDFGRDTENVRYVGPVVREMRRGREQVLSELGLPKDRKLVLVSSSGTGLGDFLLSRVLELHRKRRLGDVFLAVTGGRQRETADDIVHLGFVRDQQDLIAASDLVISLAGKSTIDEALSSGTPIIAIPLKHHFEQEKNAMSLGFRYEDVERLDELVKEKLGLRSEPTEFGGAERAAERMLGMLRPPMMKADV